MNKLIATLIAGAFALGSLAATAQVPAGDKTPAAPVDQAKMKADREATKSARAQMTSEEKNAAKKAARKQKQQEMTTIEKVGQPNQPAKTEALQKSVQATKGDPKALPGKEDRQKALKEQEKKASGQ